MIQCINEIHGGCAYILYTLKGQVKLPHFNKDMAEATGLKNPIYRPRDEVTGDIIPGRAPSMFLKLFSRGKPPMLEQSLFTDLVGNPIPWKLLEGVEMKFIPLLHIKRMFIGGGKASIQMEVLSAVVTYVKPKGTTSKQDATMNRLKANRPELQDIVAAQIAKINHDRQDQLLVSQNFQSSSQEDTLEQPTFSNITPNIPKVGNNNSNNSNNSNNINSVPIMTNISNFTSGAPSRIPAPATVPETMSFN
jgi:hypothetical protein